MLDFGNPTACPMQTLLAFAPAHLNFQTNFQIDLNHYTSYQPGLVEKNAGFILPLLIPRSGHSITSPSTKGPNKDQEPTRVIFSRCCACAGSSPCWGCAGRLCSSRKWSHLLFTSLRLAAAPYPRGSERDMPGYLSPAAPCTALPPAACRPGPSARLGGTQQGASGLASWGSKMVSGIGGMSGKREG
jgi:hypothetical protein